MAEIKKLQNQISASNTTYPPVPLNWGAEFVKTARSDTYAYIDAATRCDCTGKTVLITGGHKGIGLGIALSYARAGAARIVITSRAAIDPDIHAQIRQAASDAGRGVAPDVLALVMDVTDSASVKSAAAEVATWSDDRLDVLVCNAGFLARYENILAGDEDEWWQSFDVNLRGGYLVAKAFLPLLLTTEGGDKTVVTMSSTGAMHLLKGGSSYQISKFALLRLMEFLMSEYGDQGLLAYSVHPGGVATDLSSRLPQETQCDTLAFLTSKRQDWLAGRYLTAMWDMEEFFAKKQEIIDKDLLKMRMTF